MPIRHILAPHYRRVALQHTCNVMVAALMVRFYRQMHLGNTDCSRVLLAKTSEPRARCN